jgi:hypothetical protein
VSESAIAALYFQSLCWISLPLYPIGSILCPIFLYLNFKFELLTLVRLRGRPTQNWSDKTTNAFFTHFCKSRIVLSRFPHFDRGLCSDNLSLLLALAAYYYFIASPWICESPSGTKYGPYTDIESAIPINSLQEYATANSVLVVYSILSNGIVYASIAVGLFVYLRFQKAHFDAVNLQLRQTEELRRKEVVILQAELEKKERLIRAQQRASMLE